MNATVREAEPTDAAAIRAVHCAAFPTSAEADLVEALARDGDAVISLIAERDTAIVGHILLSRMAVSGDGHPYRGLGLAPVAVLPGAQRNGIGSALIRAALGRAVETGEALVFVLGDPVYYRRFGFSVQSATPFASPYAGPHLTALRLREDVELPRAGRADHAPAFAGLDG